ncbi:MAG: rhodanese-like domain-containing protein [Candidatus Hodarchaeales archaeon]
MEEESEIKEVKINKRSKFRMALKFVRMYFYKTIKRRWYLPSVSEITVDELFGRINSNRSPLLIDVTEPTFYRTEKEKPDNEQNELVKLSAKKIPSAKMIPILELKAKLGDLKPYLEDPIVTICPGGGMSLIAVDIMVEEGFKNVKSLTGGFELWVEKGYPTSNISENSS